MNIPKTPDHESHLWGDETGLKIVRQLHCLEGLVPHVMSHIRVLLVRRTLEGGWQ